MGFRRQTKRKQRKQKAGAYVGKGTYGCTFRPALRCEGEAERRPGKFSKLMNSELATEEMRASELLKPVDPARKYFIYPEAICKPAPLEPSDEIDKCPHDFSSLDDSRILIQADGGTNISKLSLQAADYIPFFRSLYDTIEGLYKIHEKGIAHNDIKMDNIVSLRDSTGKFLTRFIDFGFMVNTATIEDEARNIRSPFYKFEIFRSNYMFWSFDMHFTDPTFLALAQTRYELAISRQITKFYQLFYEESLSYPARALMSPKLNVANVGIMADTYARYQEQRRYAKIFTASDIHGLGITLAQIYNQFTGHRDRGYENPQICIRDNEADPVWRILDDPLVSYTEEEAAWHRTVAREISIPFFKLVRKMLVVDPAERYNAITVLSVYSEILPAIERLFTADAIRKNIKPFATLFHIRAGTPIIERETQPTPRPFPHSPLVSDNSVFALSPSISATQKGGGRRTLRRRRR